MSESAGIDAPPIAAPTERKAATPAATPSCLKSRGVIRDLRTLTTSCCDALCDPGRVVFLACLSRFLRRSFFLTIHSFRSFALAAFLSWIEAKDPGTPLVIPLVLFMR